jgi:hypothetical protein
MSTGHTPAAEFAVDAMRVGARAGRRWITTGALAFTVVFAGVAPSMPRGVHSWDNVVKVQVARNILRGEGPVLTEPTPDDPQYVLEGRDGRHYSHYPIAACILHFLTVGVEAAGGPLLLREGVPATVLLALVGWALVAWARRSGASPPAAAAGAVLTCLGTALWPFAAYGYDNLVEVLGLVMILWAGAGTERRRAWLWAGLAVGLGYATRLGAMFLVVPAAVLLLAQAPRGILPTLRRGTAFALGCAPGLMLALYYNYLRFGSIIAWNVRPTALGPAQEMFVPWFSRYHWEAMAGLTISPGKGIIWYGPPLVGVVFLAFPLVRRHRAALTAMAAYAAVALLALGRLTFWHGDWAWGPRYLAPLYVAVAPLAWWAWEQIERRGSRARIAGAVLVLVAVTLQAFPIVGGGVSTYLRGTVGPLWQSGALATQRIEWPPVPADNWILYFRPENSPIVSLARSLAEQFSDPEKSSQSVAGLVFNLPRGWLRIARLMLPAPMLGLAFVLFTRRRFGQDESSRAAKIGMSGSAA